jgi:hypothetical protein
MTSLNLPLPADGPVLLPHAVRRERPQRPAPRRATSKRAVDAADAALLAHWTRTALADDPQELSMDADAAGDAIATSGWFDSTWELSQGLEISEVQMSDLPLDGWLQFYLAN